MTAPPADVPRPARPVPPVSQVRPVLRLLREALWLRAAFAVVVFSIACVFLGRWQLHRHGAKAERADRIASNYFAPAVPLSALLPRPDSRLAAGREWSQVEVRGRYQPERTVLVRNRPLDGDNGYEVLVPLRTASGATLLVDRGWVRSGENAAAAGPVPPPPTGEVELVARLRQSEPARAGTPPPGQALRITVPAIAHEVGGDVYRVYALMAHETPAPAAAPTRLPAPDIDLGPHLAYAVQWWGFGLAGYVLLVVYAFREVARRRLEAIGPGGPGTPAVAPPTEGPAVLPAARRRRRGPDEQVEDEIIDRALAAGRRPDAAAPPRSGR